MFDRPYDVGISPRRSRSRATISDELRDIHTRSLSRGRSKSQSRVVYDSEVIRGNGKCACKCKLIFKTGYLILVNT